MSRRHRRVWIGAQRPELRLRVRPADEGQRSRVLLAVERRRTREVAPCRIGGAVEPEATSAPASARRAAPPKASPRRSPTPWSTLSTGSPVSGAAVYTWHCDRDGQYSLYSRGATTRTTCGVCRRPTPTASPPSPHLPGVLLGPLAPHPLRGLPEPRRGHGSRHAGRDVADRPAGGRLDAGLRHRRLRARASRTWPRSRWPATWCSATVSRPRPRR